jgi:uncharacterized membrane protein
MKGSAMSQNELPSENLGRSSYTVGILCMMMGGMVVAIATGLIHTDQSKIHAPTWVLVIFGLTFVLAGLWATFQTAVRSHAADSSLAGWIIFAFALLVMLAISVICLWIGFGPGVRMFVQDIGIGIDPATRPVDPISGRIFFGIFGILMSLVTILVTVSQVRKSLGR